MASKTMLDTLLGHDAWTTHYLLHRCGALSDTQLDQVFDIGHQTIRQTFVHLIDNVETWSDLLAERPVRANTGDEATIKNLLARLEWVTADFHHIVQGLSKAGRLDDTFLDTLDNPPRLKRFGTTILHLIAHSMIHRSEILHMMERLGMTNLIEDSPLTWEEQYSKEVNYK